MEKLCVIFGAGECVKPRRSLTDNDLIIGADGGYAAAVKFGLEPSVAIGDFDSGEEPTGVAAHVIKLSRDKDDTDTLAAIKLGLRRGYRTFVIYGGVGGRPDHTFANIAALKYLNAFDAKGFLVDRESVATVITDERFAVPAKARGTVSVFAYGGDAEGVTLSGLRYPLKNARLTSDKPIGVSNATTDERAAVSVKSGSLLIYFPRA